MADKQKPKARRHFSDKEIIKALEKHAGLVSPAAESLDMHRCNLHKRIAKSPELQDKLTEIRESALDTAEDVMWKLVKAQDGAMVRFVLQTLGKGRGFTKTTEVTGKDGAPIGVQPIFNFPDNGRDGK